MLAIFIFLNIVAFFYYSGRTYPQTFLGSKNVSGQSFAEISQHPLQELVPAEIEVSAQGLKEKVKTLNLGPMFDKDQAVARIKERRSFMPVVNLFKTHKIDLPLNFDEVRLNHEIDRLSENFHRAPQNARIVLEGGEFRVEPSQRGQQVDENVLKKSVTSAATTNQAAVAVPVKILPPDKSTDNLKPVLSQLQKQQKTEISFVYGQKRLAATSQVITSWYVPQNDIYELSDSQIAAYIQKLGASWGIGVDNTAAAASEAKKALMENQKTSITLIARKALKNYKYCTALRGVDDSYLSGLNSKAASVLADARGWGLVGLVAFSQTTSGCNFTIWLSAADQMASFGGECDADWSCRIGSSVVINFDRWRFASSAWNASGGSLDDYRSMVINHEVGHWLGFGHRNCGGADQLAPVMQQQSIDLQGCKFNPWPLSAELAALKANLSI